MADDRSSILEAIADIGSDLRDEAAAYVPPSSDLWEEFRENLEALGGKIIDDVELHDLERRPKWVDAIVGHLQTDVESIWDAEVGFAKAVCAIAQTGTLAFASGPESQRLTTLVPPASVVFVERDAIVPTLAEALETLRACRGRSYVLVTGPSRTADIEGILVRGVHGPGELLVKVVH